MREKTTYPPYVLSGSVGTVSFERAVARGDGEELFSGYYYDALDFIASGLTIDASATLRIEPGTALGIDFTSSPFGIQMGNGSQLISEGAPLSPNRFVLSHGVQEGQCNWPYWPAPMWSTFHGGEHANAQARFRFTEFPVQANDYAYHLSPDSQAGSFEFKDCRFYGGFWITSSGLTLTTRNTLFYRTRFDMSAVYEEIYLDFRNTLFKDIPWFWLTRDGELGPGITFTFHDNVFHNSYLACDPAPVSSHNRSYPWNPLGTANGNDTMSHPCTARVPSDIITSTRMPRTW